MVRVIQMQEMEQECVSPVANGSHSRKDSSEVLTSSGGCVKLGVISFSGLDSKTLLTINYEEEERSP